MKILLLGAKGQLGCQFLNSPEVKEFDIISPDSSKLNICNYKELESTILTFEPDIILNFSAYTNVDLAEDQFEEAKDVNLVGVKNIVELSNKYNNLVIHISTDYVFGGHDAGPFKPYDKISPINNYGISKAEGDEFMLNNSDKGIIIRTASLYGSYRNNFFKSFLKKLVKENEINVVSDQKISLTYSLDLSNFIIKLLLNYKDNLSQYEKGTVKIYHIVNAGYTSWYKVAITMARKLKESYPNLEKINVNPISYKDWDSKTPRPYDSRLLLSNENDYDFKFKMPSWDYSLNIAIKEFLDKNKKLGDE